MQRLMLPMLQSMAGPELAASVDPGNDATLGQRNVALSDSSTVEGSAKHSLGGLLGSGLVQLAEVEA